MSHTPTARPSTRSNRTASRRRATPGIHTTAATRPSAGPRAAYRSIVRVGSCSATTGTSMSLQRLKSVRATDPKTTTPHTPSDGGSSSAKWRARSKEAFAFAATARQHAACVHGDCSGWGSSPSRSRVVATWRHLSCSSSSSTSITSPLWGDRSAAPTDRTSGPAGGPVASQIHRRGGARVAYDHRQAVGFVLGVADTIRDAFKQHQYGEVILPFVVLRRRCRWSATTCATRASSRRAAARPTERWRRSLTSSARSPAFARSQRSASSTPASSPTAPPATGAPRRRRARRSLRSRRRLDWALLDLAERVELTHLRIDHRGARAMDLVAEEAEVCAVGAGVGRSPRTSRNCCPRSCARSPTPKGRAWANRSGAVRARRRRASPTTRRPRGRQVDPSRSLDPVFDRLWVDAVVEVMEANAELGKRLLDDERFASLVRLLLLQVAHRRARDEPPRARPSPVA